MKTHQARTTVPYTWEDFRGDAFYKFPKWLFHDPELKSLPARAKHLYMFFLNRNHLSFQNDDRFTDERGEIFFICTRAEMRELLDSGYNQPRIYIEALKRFGLLREVRRGLNRPNLLYLLRPKEPANPQNKRMHSLGASGCTSSVYTDAPLECTLLLDKDRHDIDRDSVSQSVTPEARTDGRTDENKPTEHREEKKTEERTPPKHREEKKTDKNKPTEHREEKKTEKNKPTEYRKEKKTEEITLPNYRVYEEIVKKNIAYDDFAMGDNIKLVDSFVDIIVDVLATPGGTVRIDGEDKPRELVKSAYMKLTYGDIEIAMDKFSSVRTPIKRTKDYIRTLLYNLSIEMEAHLNNFVNSYRRPGNGGG